MKTVPATKFKNSAAEILEEVYTSGIPVLVTKRGEPIAQVLPPPQSARPMRFGGMKGRAQILGDIVESVSEWNPDFPDGTDND